MKQKKINFFCFEKNKTKNIEKKTLKEIYQKKIEGENRRKKNTKKKMNMKIWIFIFLLSIAAAFLSQFSLFLQTHSYFHNHSYFFKIGMSLMLMFVQWSCIIPFMRLGMKVMNPVQITLYTFVLIFIVQIITNKFVFQNPNPVEDIIAACIMILASFVSSFQLFG